MRMRSVIPYCALMFCTYIGSHTAYVHPQTPKQEHNYEEAANLDAEREKMQRDHDVFYLLKQV